MSKIRKKKKNEKKKTTYFAVKTFHNEGKGGNTNEMRDNYCNARQHGKERNGTIISFPSPSSSKHKNKFRELSNNIQTKKKNKIESCRRTIFSVFFVAVFLLFVICQPKNWMKCKFFPRKKQTKNPEEIHHGENESWWKTKVRKKQNKTKQKKNGKIESSSS